jgi:cytoskeletal protein RodZ
MVAAYLASAKLEPEETDMQAMSGQVTAARAGALESAVSGTTLVGVLALIVALGLGALWLREQRREAREQAAASSQAARAPVSAPPPAAAAPMVVEPGTASNAGAGAAENATQNATQNAGPSAAENATQNAPQSGKQPAVSNAVAGAGAGSANPAAKAAVGVAAQPVAAVASAAASPATKAGAASNTAQAGSSAAAAPVEVSVSATQRAWISVRSDGKTVETLTLDPNNPEMRSRSYKAKEKLTLLLGNAAGVTVTYNGKPAGMLGGVGDRATVTFTPQGMEKQ